MNSAFSVIKAEYQTNQTVAAAAIWLSFSGSFFSPPTGAMLTFLSFHATPGKTDEQKNKISMKYLLFMSSFYSDFPLCDSSYLALIWFHAAERLQRGSADGFCLRESERQRDDFELFAQIVWEHKTLPLSLWLTRSCTQRGVSHVGPHHLTQMNDILQLNLKRFLFAL